MVDPRRQQPKQPKTANELFFDALVRHQIGLLRFSGSVRNRLTGLLDKTEADLAEEIRRRLKNHQGLESPRSVRRMQLLLDSIKKTRLSAWREVTAAWVEELTELSLAEPTLVSGMVKTVSPAVLETVLPAASALRSIVRSHPFEGRTLREWASRARRADLDRIEAQIKIGMVQGEGSAAIARRVVGTKVLKGRDGVTQAARRDVAGITRTAVNAISNKARQDFTKANTDLFDEELYVATLDARTTPICRSLDGDRFEVGEGPIPPMHFSCRSLRIAIISQEAIGNRPMRNFTERQLAEEFTEQNGLPSVRRRADLPRGTKGSFDEFARRRMRELTGTVPAKTTYQQWLGGQPADFQDDILGVTRGRLFRRGNLTLDKFVNRAGDEIPLSELARKERAAFVAAGLNPESFI